MIPFLNLLLDMVQLQLTLDLLINVTSVVMICLSYFSILLMLLTLQAIFVEQCWTFAHVTKFWVFDWYLYCDSDNEGKYLWSMAFKCEKNSLESCLSNPRQMFVCDRLKGQSNTLPQWYPEACMDIWTYHIKENMKKRKNGNATKQETKCFDKYVISENLTKTATNKTELLTSVNPRTKKYIEESLFLNNSHLSRFLWWSYHWYNTNKRWFSYRRERTCKIITTIWTIS